MNATVARMNTRANAAIGEGLSIRDNPIVKCVYQADIEDNKFLIKGVEDEGVRFNQEAVQF